MMSTDDEEFENDASLFKEPDDFYQQDKPPTFVEYTLADGKALKLRLVGHNPLWVRSFKVSDIAMD
jgi:nicotinamide N-methyltransferase